MKKIDVDDIVINKDDKIIYEIVSLKNDVAIIKGVFYRIIKQVNITNLKLCDKSEYNEKIKEEKNYSYKVFNGFKRKNKIHLPGKILHIDGDQKYLDKCIDLYDEVGVYAYGVKLKESQMSIEIIKYLDIVNPDVIVITGHDLFNNGDVKEIENYTNSKYYIETVKEIRKRDKSVVIIAGACQSNFEALIASGANFASSPARINIHTFDPAVIAIRVATTSFLKVVEFDDILKYIENGKRAFNGVETLGKMRLLL